MNIRILIEDTPGETDNNYRPIHGIVYQDRNSKSDSSLRQCKLQMKVGDEWIYIPVVDERDL